MPSTCTLELPPGRLQADALRGLTLPHRRPCTAFRPQGVADRAHDDSIRCDQQEIYDRKDHSGLKVTDHLGEMLPTVPHTDQQSWAFFDCAWAGHLLP